MDIPIKTLHLFPILDEQLVSLLKSLSAEDWNRPTLAKQWTVKDIAAHLLDGNLRTLSMLRDNYFGEKPDKVDQEGIVRFLNLLNSDWVKGFRRISPVILIQLLESSGKEYNHFLTTLDPFAPASFSVGWAGETVSLNWFHIARDFTEKWHHQKQIREAVGVNGIMEKEFTQPLFQTFLKALPHTYRNTVAPVGTTIEVRINAEGGGNWRIRFDGQVWRFVDSAEKTDCQISIDPDNAWKLFTKGISGEEALQKAIVTGDVNLSKPFFSMVSIMG